MLGRTSIQLQSRKSAWCFGALPARRWLVAIILAGLWLGLAAECNAWPQSSSGDVAAAQPTPTETQDPVELEEIRKRVQTIAWCCGGLLGIIVVALSYFRLNHATRGIYSRRLLIFAILIATLLVVICVVSLAFIWR